MSAEAELARRRAVNAERQRRWRERNGPIRQAAFAALRDAHRSEWKELCALHREALVDGEGEHLVYQRARTALIANHRTEWADALAAAEASS